MAKKNGVPENNNQERDTTLVHAGTNPHAHEGAFNTPVYHASTILFPTVKDLEDNQTRPLSYGIRGTPTMRALQEALTELEDAHGAIITPSGLSAVTTALLSVLKSGDHVLIADSVYSPTRHFCAKILPRYGIDVSFYPPRIGAAISDLFRAETCAVFLESPGSLTFDIQDVPAIADSAHKAELWVLMDNSWASPLFFQPLHHEVDISIQALTKYVSGHADVMLGSIATNERAWTPVDNTHQALGLTAGPDDIYMALRGMRTLGVRLPRHQESALTVARWLEARPEVEAVLYPALESHADHDLWQRDFSGASGLFSVILKPRSARAVAAMLDSMAYFGMGYSWGGMESLILPVTPHRTAGSWEVTGPMLRIHIGLEDSKDLIHDLEAGFERLRSVD
ncbi:MAG: cystathionine beta-lyase [Parvularculales bacterium]